MCAFDDSWVRKTVYLYLYSTVGIEQTKRKLLTEAERSILRYFANVNRENEAMATTTAAVRNDRKITNPDETAWYATGILILTLNAHKLFTQYAAAFNFAVYHIRIFGRGSRRTFRQVYWGTYAKTSTAGRQCNRIWSRSTSSSTIMLSSKNLLTQYWKLKSSGIARTSFEVKAPKLLCFG